MQCIYTYVTEYNDISMILYSKYVNIAEFMCGRIEVKEIFLVYNTLFTIDVLIQL